MVIILIQVNFSISKLSSIPGNKGNLLVIGTNKKHPLEMNNLLSSIVYQHGYAFWNNNLLNLVGIASMFPNET